MSEAEWLTSEDPKRLLELLLGQASGRKLRLFGCACCRCVWPLLEERYRLLVDTVERFAEGLSSHPDLRGARQKAEAWGRPGQSLAYAAASAAIELARTSKSTAYRVLQAAVWVAHTCGWETGAFDQQRLARARRLQCEFIRDIFHSPSPPAARVAVWRTPAALGLARMVYEERAFDRLPILADALEDAGCTDRVLLDHLRGPGPHVRGCWALDLILGKE